MHLRMHQHLRMAQQKDRQRGLQMDQHRKTDLPLTLHLQKGRRYK